MKTKFLLSLAIAIVLTILCGISFSSADEIQYDASDSPFGFHPAKISTQGYEKKGYSDASEIGVQWVRPMKYVYWFMVQPDINNDEYDFSVFDEQFGEIPEEFSIMANISPQPTLKDLDRCLDGSWIPIDQAQYVNFVKAVVERYDGDGIDDMPGLVNPIQYWQVGNEPDNQKRSDFSELQKITFQAIKDACSDCQVIIGGFGSQLPEKFIKRFEIGYAPILKELNGQYIDILDFHWYGNALGHYQIIDPTEQEDILDYIRSILDSYGFPPDLPIWITEMGSFSGHTTDFDYEYQSEQQQAIDYFKRFIYALSKGVKKVFPAFGLIEGWKDEDTYFDQTGLIYDGVGSYDLGFGVKKLGYFTYKKMTEELSGADFSTLTQVSEDINDENLHLFKVFKNGRAIFIAWWDYFEDPYYNPGETRIITLNQLMSSRVTVTSITPDVESGSDVTDYATAFNTKTYNISEESLTIEISESPVLIIGELSGKKSFIRKEQFRPAHKP